MPCSCSLRVKLAAPALGALDADLRAGGPANSVRKVAERHGCPKSTVGHHRRSCLGLDVSTDAGSGGQAADELSKPRARAASILASRASHSRRIAAPAVP